MKYCEKCKINTTDERSICPLCQAELVTDANHPNKDYGERFKYVATVYRQHATLFKILAFLSVVVVVAAFAINIMLERGWWSLLVALGVASVWVSLLFAIRKHRNIAKAILYQVVIVSVLSVLWDLSTVWHGWSIDYVIPLICIAAMITLAVLAKIMAWRIEFAFVYFGIDAIFGIIPVIFYLTGLLHVTIPSILCIASSLISLGALITFNGKTMLSELKRRFDI